MPPKPTRTPERISLPGGYYWLENGATDGDIWSPSHAIIFQYVTREIAISFAAAMDAKAPFMKTEGVDFSQMDLTPNAISVVQSPAGEINEACIKAKAYLEVLNEFKRPDGKLMQAITGMATAQVVSVAAEVVGGMSRALLPPAPTGEAE